MPKTVRELTNEIINRKFISAAAFEKWLHGKGFKIIKLEANEQSVSEG